MSDNLVLELLRTIRGDIGEIKTDIVALKERIGLLEGATASLSRRLDRVAGDVEQIKRRLVPLSLAPKTPIFPPSGPNRS